MAEAFVYLTLATLLLAVHSTTAFLSNIHEHMSEAEKLEIFGSHAWLPVYEVFPMSLTGMTRRRRFNEDIQCTLTIFNEEITLNLRPTPQYLATKSTPVWLAVTDGHSGVQISYRSLSKAMSDVGNFTMYQDVDNGAALAVYTDTTEGIVIDGIISSWGTIRSLPKSLIGELLNSVDSYTDEPYTMGGAITSEEDTGFYVVSFSHLSTGPAPYAPQRSIREIHEREKRARGKGKIRQKVDTPEKLYPQMLIVLDHNAIRHRKMNQSLRNLLAFWNAMDLVYRTLDSPTIRLNIAGIIIGADDIATPYIAKNVSATAIGDLDGVLSKMGKHFYKRRVRFPIKRFDTIIAMTPMKLCTKESNLCQHSESLPGYAKQLPVCSSNDDAMRTKTLNNTMIIHYNGTFGPEHLFIVQDDHGYSGNSDCDPENHGGSTNYRSFQWSNCSKKFYSHIVTSKNIECLRNRPSAPEPIHEIFPIRLSMDRQCQNEGFTKSCTLPDEIEVCAAKGCKTRDETCVRSSVAPLLGSKCGVRMFCNRRRKCVHT